MIDVSRDSDKVSCSLHSDEPDTLILADGDSTVASRLGDVTIYGGGASNRKVRERCLSANAYTVSAVSCLGFQF